MVGFFFVRVLFKVISFEFASLMERDLFIQAVILSVLLSGIPLLATLGTALVVGVIQAATQVQEQTLTFVPKLCVVVLVYYVFGEWMLDHLKTYCEAVLTSITGM